MDSQNKMNSDDEMCDSLIFLTQCIFNPPIQDFTVINYFLTDDRFAIELPVEPFSL